MGVSQIFRDSEVTSGRAWGCYPLGSQCSTYSYGYSAADHAESDRRKISFCASLYKGVIKGCALLVEPRIIEILNENAV